MSWQRLYTFQAGTKINSGQVNGEFDQLIGVVNQLQTDDETKDTNLRAIAQLTKITNDSGGVKLNITDNTKNLLTELAALGTGMHTFYAVDGTINLPNGKSTRGIFHNTGANIGWLIAFDYTNTLYYNYYNAGTWMGWNLKPYVESNKTDLGNIQPNTWTKILNGANTNRGTGTWSNGDYTVPSAGVYQCSLAAYVDELIAGKSLATAVYKNGVLNNQNRLGLRQTSGTADGILVGSTVVDCAAGDVLSFYVFQGDTVARPLNYAHMKIAKL